PGGTAAPGQNEEHRHGNCAERVTCEHGITSNRHNPSPSPVYAGLGHPCAYYRQAPDARVTRAIRRRGTLSCGVFSSNAKSSRAGNMTAYQCLINSGFAAIVAWYVLARLEPSIRQLERTVNLLAIVVAKSSGIDYDEVRREYHGGNEGR